MKRSINEAEQASWEANKDFKVRLGPGIDSISTATQSNYQFRVGLKLLGLELQSKAGYSNITQLTWSNDTSMDGCKKYLYGRGVKPGNADEIFTHTEAIGSC